MKKRIYPPLPRGEGWGEGKSAANAAQERYATITDIREELKTTQVFNLEVAHLHTFFVGVDGVVVHNAKRGPKPAGEGL